MTVWRIKFSIKGRLCYLSHLDMLTVWERALRRGNIPVLYSQGFNPHMLISFGPAHAVGVEGEGEYMDIDTMQGLKEENWFAFNSCLPEGIKIFSARELEQGTPSLMQAVNIADYSLRLSEFDKTAAEKAIADFFAADEVMFERKSPKGNKLMNFRPAIKAMEIRDDNILFVRIWMTNKGTPRPFEVARLIVPEARVLGCCRDALLIENAAGELSLP
ncbi:MAG: DUF2344 domain-containing protein [Firmicutes bacterium]|nr:DUF2344 domain-containing protein [Bacillota bacterium]